MPSSRGASASGGKGPRAPRARAGPSGRSTDHLALLGASAALGLADNEEDIARLTASAVASALSAALGAVVLHGERRPQNLVVGQLGNAPLHAALAREVESLVLSSAVGTPAPSAESPLEFNVPEEALPHAARAGLRRLAMTRLGTPEATLGALVAGKTSSKPWTAEDRTSLEALSRQASLALQRLGLNERLLRQASDLSILNAIAAAASQSLDSEDVLDATLRKALELTEMDAGAVLTVDEGGQTLDVVSAFLPGPVLEHLRTACALGELRVGAGVPGEAAASGEAIVVTDVASDEREAGGPIQSAGFRSHLCIPLRAKGRIHGVLGLLSYSRSEFRSEDIDLYQSIANFMGMAEANARAYEQSREQATLEERNRLAREIHDTLAQSIVGIMVRLEAAEALANRDPEAARAEVHSARELARQSLEEARRSVWNLHPRALGTGTLTEAVRREIERAQAEGIEASLEIDGTEPTSIDSRCELAVLRIAQEAISNTLRHARARSVRVTLSFGVDEMCLLISDDGIGFDPSAEVRALSPTGGGFGMTSMQERARLVGGWAEVRGAPGMGTQVEAMLPCSPGREEAPSLTSTSTTANIPAKGASEGIRVLIVDDHEVVRRGIRSVLERAEGMVVVGEATDGEAAIEEIRTRAPDVVLMDLQMPKLDGVGALQRLREMGLHAPVILLSVYGKDEHIFAGLKAGARGYLLKDVSRDDLIHAIRTVHEGGSLLQPMAATRLIERLESGGRHRLTERELEVLRLLASGARNKEIAAKLVVSIGTVKFHIANIYQKLGVQTRTEAVRAAAERGILSI